MQKNILTYEAVISDCSSLSNLINIGTIDILKELYKSVAITPQILEEYKEGFTGELPDWIQIKGIKNIELYNKINEKYGEGESSAIVYALENPNTLIIIDDQRPKEYAKNEYGLPTIGTIGIIRQAVDKNIIKSKVEANHLYLI
jgi:predicted nucleic acid-binding protein